MASSRSLSIDNAWNSVAVEERLELLGSAQAQGIFAAIVAFYLFAAVSYGFNEVLGIAFALVGALIVLPSAANREWNKNRSKTILRYLAARSVARRYAFGYRIRQLDTLLMFRGSIREEFASKEQEENYRQSQDELYEENREVWICLLRGGVVVISERLGGAKLEFLSPIATEHCCSILGNRTDESGPVTIEGSGISKGRTISLDSEYPAALYVFRKKLSRLINENASAKERMAQLTRK